MVILPRERGSYDTIGLIYFKMTEFHLNSQGPDNDSSAVGPYIVTARSHWIPKAIGRGELAGRKNEFPQIIYLFGPTGAGKTELAQLYAREQGISYDATTLARKAGVNIDFSQLRNDLHVDPRHSIHVLSIPKFTSRDARPTETQGIEFYFTGRDVWDTLEQEGRLAFSYQYPKDGAWYGMPNSISWSLKSGRDSITTMTGYEAVRKMSDVFPDAIGIFVDARTSDIEAHIKGRAASEQEKRSRLASFVQDKHELYENRGQISYSVFIDSLRALRRDITPDRLGQLLREMDDPLRQIKAIVRFEGYLKKKGIKLSSNPQDKFNYFLDHAVGLLFHGMEYKEIEEMVRDGHYVKAFDKQADSDLLERYTQDKGISRALLDNLVESIQVTAALEANGRRTIVLSPYSTDYISAVGGTGKRVVLDLLARKLNGTGAHLVHDDTRFTNQSLLSLVQSKFYHLDEGIYVTLSSDHVPVRELEKPRALNILFTDALPDEARKAIKPLNLEDTVNISARLARDETLTHIFQRATQP